MLKCHFNKVALLSNFIEIALRHRCSPVNLLHIFSFRTPFPKYSAQWLLLPILIYDDLSSSNCPEKQKELPLVF